MKKKESTHSTSLSSSWRLVWCCVKTSSGCPFTGPFLHITATKCHSNRDLLFVSVSVFQWKWTAKKYRFEMFVASFRAICLLVWTHQHQCDPVHPDLNRPLLFFSAATTSATWWSSWRTRGSPRRNTTSSRSSTCSSPQSTTSSTWWRAARTWR